MSYKCLRGYRRKKHRNSIHIPCDSVHFTFFVRTLEALDLNDQSIWGMDVSHMKLLVCNHCGYTRLQKGKMIWEQGRQGGGYYKLKLWESKRFKFDIYLLKFDPGAEIKAHKDPSVEGHEHHRLNIILKRGISGLFWTMQDGELLPKYNNSRIVKFRPDKVLHGLVPYVSTGEYEGLWLSIGWLRKV